MIRLTKNVSWQCPQVTRHIPGIVGTGGVTGEGAKLIILLQFGRGHATRWDELLQINRQLHGQRTYFLPGGAFLRKKIIWKTNPSIDYYNILTLSADFYVNIIYWKTTWKEDEKKAFIRIEHVCCKTRIKFQLQNIFS
jgi:hypothetical protein